MNLVIKLLSIKSNVTNTIIIKNSKFISFIYKVYNVNEVNKYLDEVKKRYKDATHYCYAYIIDENKKFSDDNEPGGTAGSPMLQVLEKKELNYVLCVVVRYFGGIKLGAGGLVRAYSKSVSTCLDKVLFVKLVKGKNIDIIFSYDKVKIIDSLLKECYILNKEFNDMIKYNVNIDDDLYNEIKDIYNIKVVKDVYIEK